MLPFCFCNMGCYKPNEFARRNDLGSLPESRKMPQIARYQIIGTCRISKFQEPIVVGIACHFKTPRGYDQITSVADELQQLAPKALADFQLRAGKDIGTHRGWAGRRKAGRAWLRPGELSCVVALRA